MNSTLLLLHVVMRILAGLILLFRRMAIRNHPMNERLQVYAALPDQTRRDNRRRTWLTRLRVRLNATFSGLTSEDLALRLMSANWPITPVEYIGLRILGT